VAICKVLLQGGPGGHLALWTQGHPRPHASSCTTGSMISRARSEGHGAGPPTLLVLALALAACAREPAQVAAPSAAAPRSAPQRVITTPPHWTKLTRAPKDPQAPKAPSLAVLVRDPRPDIVSPRPFQLVVTEIQGVRSLVSSSFVPVADRPKWLRRRADLYAEWALRYPHDRPSLVRGTRKAAIQDYETLVQQYPSWCAVDPGTSPGKMAGCADEAIYCIGLEAERDNDPPRARHVYRSLLHRWPTSSLAALAHLGIGETYLAESAGDDSRLSSAEQAYLEALQHAAPDDPVRAYAWLQLGRVHLRRGDKAHAMGALQKAVDWCAAHPTAHAAGDIADAARAELPRMSAP
jgi:hypothetical protein